MKNLFLSALLVLTVSFSFANNKVERISNFNLSETLELTNSEVVIENNVIDTFSFNDVQLDLEQVLKDCTLKGKFTITFPDGSEYSWKGTLTIVGQSCAEFLKDLMKK